MLYFSITLLVLLFILSLIGNILVIVSALFNKRLRNYTHALIINVAVSDLLISIFSLPLRILRLSISKNLFNAPLIETHTFCKFTTCATIIPFAASNFFLLLLTVDRYFAVKHVFYYKVSFRKKHMVILIVSAWILAVTVGVIPMFVYSVQSGESNDSGCTYASVFHPGYTIFINVFTYFAPSLLMLILYVLIIRKVRDSLVIKGRDRIRTSLTEKMIRRRERRMTMGILFVLATHTACMAPICILDLVQIIGKINAPVVAIEICLFLTYANQVANAPIYAAANRQYYSTFKSVICCFGRANAVCKACAAFSSRRKTLDLAVHARLSNSSGNAWYIAKISGI